MIALIAIGASAVHKQLRDGNDFPLYWQAARDLLAGRSPYQVGAGLHGYVYLPWFALLLAPLALLPLPVAATVWYAANVAFTWLAGRALIGALRDAGMRVRGDALALATLPLVALFHDNLVLGQANLFLLWLVALSVRAATHGRESPARAAALGLAGALKMPAAVLLAPLALRGRPRAVAGFMLGATLALGLPFFVTGIPAGARLMDEWRSQVAAPAAAGTLQGSKVIDQSPQAALRRLLVSEPAFGDHTVNVAALAPSSFAAVSRAASAALFAAYLTVWLFAPARDRPRALLVDLGLGCCAMVQLTGFSLKAQFVVLLLPAWLAAAIASERRGRVSRALLGAAGALFLLSQPGLVGRAASNLLLAYSSMALGTLLLAGSLAWFRWTAVTPPPSAGPAGAPGTGTVP